MQPVLIWTTLTFTLYIDKNSLNILQNISCLETKKVICAQINIKKESAYVADFILTNYTSTHN